MEAFIPQLTRKMPLGRRRRRNRAGSEDLLIIALLVAVGLFPIALVVSRGGRFGVEPTLGMLIVFFALKQLIEHSTPRVRAWRRLERRRRARRLRSDSED